jgi:hypothetical protein
MARFPKMAVDHTNACSTPTAYTYIRLGTLEHSLFPPISRVFTPSATDNKRAIGSEEWGVESLGCSRKTGPA